MIINTVIRKAIKYEKTIQVCGLKFEYLEFALQELTDMYGCFCVCLCACLQVFKMHRKIIWNKLVQEFFFMVRVEVLYHGSQKLSVNQSLSEKERESREALSLCQYKWKSSSIYHRVYVKTLLLWDSHNCFSLFLRLNFLITSSYLPNFQSKKRHPVIK